MLSLGLEVPFLTGGDLDPHTSAQLPHWWEGRSVMCSTREHKEKYHMNTAEFHTFTHDMQNNTPPPQNISCTEADLAA